MQITALKTHKITSEDTTIIPILDRYIPILEENTIVAVTSKIISICEGRLVSPESIDKDTLVAQEAELYLPREMNKYQVMLTIKQHILAAAAGIDESNGNGYFILWPENPQRSANQIREYLQTKFKRKHLGVVITDSKTTPLRWGVTGIGLSHSGFLALNDYIGSPDIFGHLLHMTKVNVMDGLAGAAVYAMGEGREQTPLALITDIPNVQFQERNPIQEELDALAISLDDDIYGEMLKKAEWKKGGGK